MDLIKFRPVYDERIWGGRALEGKLRRLLPDGVSVGESREICDRPEHSSDAEGGEFAGMALKEILAGHGAEIMGPKWKKGAPFPIFIKWLDCCERLSLQVHPDAKNAEIFGGTSKSEAWYFADCEEGAQYVLGLREGNDAQSLIRGIEGGTLEDIVVKRSSRNGDFVFIPHGCIHAIGGGNLVFEIQENSDTTYRVFDWNRLDADGSARPLHVEESLGSIDFSSPAPVPIPENSEKFRTLCETEKFSIMRVKLSKGETFSVGAFEEPRIISVMKGSLKSANGSVGEFESALLPYAQNFEFEAGEDSTVLITRGFAKI